MSTKADGEGIVCGVDWILAWNLILAGSMAKISKLQDLTSSPPPPPKPNSRIPMVFLFSSSARVSGLFLKSTYYTGIEYFCFCVNKQNIFQKGHKGTFENLCG
jgi:hypothetical protein